MRTLKVMLIMYSTLLVAATLAQQAQPGAAGRRGGRGQRGDDAPAQMQEGGRGQRGNFDPAQMQERMLNMQKQQLEVSDENWEAIEPLLADVMTKQRAARELQQRGWGRARGGAQAQAAEVDAVNQAIEGNNAEELQKALADLRTARQAREAELKKAQDALREVLTLQQEAKLVIAGVLE